MKIAINAQLLSLDNSYRSAGVSQHIYHLLKALSRVNSKDISVFVRKQKEYIPGFKYLETSFSSSNRILRILWEQVVLPQLIKEHGIDLLHSPMHILPLNCRCKSVVTIHDLSFLRLKDTHKGLQRWYLKNFTYHSCKKADKIIAVSENTKKDIVDLFKIDNKKIRVIYNGVSDIFKVIDDKERLNKVRNKYNLPDKFILYVGTLEPRKNIPGLIKAFNICKESKSLSHKLVITGSKGWGYSDIFKLIEDLGLKDEVIFTGFIENSDLPYIYNLADLFIYPSFYEGFGLPPLESMASGTPVITSNTSSLKEVVDDAGIVVDPYDIEGLAENISAVLNNNDLYIDLRNKGLKRAEKFSWDKTAKETLKVYDEVLEAVKYR